MPATELEESSESASACAAAGADRHARPAIASNSGISLRSFILIPFAARVSSTDAELVFFITLERTCHGHIGTQSQLPWILLPYRLDRNISRQVAPRTGRGCAHTSFAQLSPSWFLLLEMLP